MHFCRDCQHYGVIEIEGAIGCYHPDNGRSPVTGKMKRAEPELARANGGFCGPNGSKWEMHQRQSLLKRLLRGGPSSGGTVFTY